MPKRPYRVVVEKRACSHCLRGGIYIVVGPDVVVVSRSFEDIEDARDLAKDCNDAYQLGVQVLGPLRSREQQGKGK